MTEHLIVSTAALETIQVDAYIESYASFFTKLCPLYDKHALLITVGPHNLHRSRSFVHHVCVYKSQVQPCTSKLFHDRLKNLIFYVSMVILQAQDLHGPVPLKRCPDNKNQTHTTDCKLQHTVTMSAFCKGLASHQGSFLAPILSILAHSSIFPWESR